jgi:HD-like signal output (HDOD) protein
MVETAKTIPQTLTQWQQQLRSLKLPADPVVKAAALQKLVSPTGNADNIANILKGDPALCLLIFSETNKVLHRSGNETASLSHCLSLLGFPYVEKLLRRTPEYDKKNFPYLKQYRQQLSISLHAGYQTEAWAKQNPYWPEDELFWPAVFQRAPIWSLWYQAGEQMQQLESLRATHQGANQPALEKKIFGCSLLMLGSTLARDWHLAKVTRHSLAANKTGNSRHWIMLSKINPNVTKIAMEQFPNLLRICSAPAFAIALANRLADEADWDWHSTRTFRLEKIVATCLHIDHHQAVSLCHQQAAAASRQINLPGTITPATQLLCHYQKAYEINLANEVINKDINATITSDSKPQVKPNQTNSTATSPIDQLLYQLTEQPQSFHNQHQVMNAVVSSLCKVVNMDRATVLLLNRKTKILRSYYNSGCDNYPELKYFRHTLQQGELFNKLLQKTLSVRLHSGNHQKIWPLLPERFKTACDQHEFFMVSIFINQRPTAIIYADCGISQRPLSSSQYSRFKQLGQALSLCLQSRSSS